jgi:hypothetical protein
MPEPISAGIAAVSSIGGGVIQSGAARRAGRAQTQAAEASIAEQRRQFEAVRQLLNPYVEAGTPALRGMMDIAGVGGGRGTDWASYVNANPDALENWNSLTPEQRAQFGNNIATFGEYHWNEDGARRDISQFGGTDAAQAQQRAIAGLEASPIFQTLARQGEDAIAQNASATGGLRGGNTQGALARFRPALLDRFIEQQYGRMADIAGRGQGAAMGLGQAGLETGQSIGQTMIGAGQARAGAIGAQGQIWSNTLGQLGGMATNIFGARAARGGSGPSAALVPSVNQTIASNPGIF